MQFIRRQLPLWITFFGALYIFISWYIPSSFTFQIGQRRFVWLGQDIITGWSNWIIIISGVALFYGILTLIVYGWSKVRSRQPGYGYSIIMLLSLALMTILGLLYGTKAAPHVTSISYLLAPGRLQVGQEFALGLFGQINPFQWMYTNVMLPLSATMFSLLAFYIASAAFRTFRAKTTEATILLIAGVLVMLGRVSSGDLVPQLSFVSDYIMNILNASGQRGILLGIVLGQIAFSVRIIFGIERSYLGGGD